jgi:hypothetical protein
VAAVLAVAVEAVAVVLMQKIDRPPLPVYALWFTNSNLPVIVKEYLFA